MHERLCLNRKNDVDFCSQLQAETGERPAPHERLVPAILDPVREGVLPLSLTNIRTGVSGSKRQRRPKRDGGAKPQTADKEKRVQRRSEDFWGVPADPKTWWREV